MQSISHKKNNPWSYLNIFNPDEENLKSEKDNLSKKVKEKFDLMNQ